MIRTLGLIDAFRVAAVSTPDIAAYSTYAVAGHQPALQGFAFVVAGLRSKRTSVALVALEEGKLLGMASARRASGPTAWFVDHLALPTNKDAPIGELLEAASAYAGRRGAERLFLKLPDTWDIQKLASQSGFFPSYQALLLTLPGRSPLYKEESLLNTRLRRPADDL
ncbi:MAG: hypothetical protein HY533_04210, partial [Chloroflexi bacterium]|nr:hypothetical protein [Chloroflexota bacterium]